MSEGDTSELDHDADHLAEGDERYLLRNKRQIRGLLQQLIDQRAVVTMHVAGRDMAVPTAVLEVDEDDDCVILDGSHNDASNRAIEQAKYLLCYAQLERVNIRFRLETPERLERDIHVAFRATCPIRSITCSAANRTGWKHPSPIHPPAPSARMPPAAAISTCSCG